MPEQSTLQKCQTELAICLQEWKDAGGPLSAVVDAVVTVALVMAVETLKQSERP